MAAWPQALSTTDPTAPGKCRAAWFVQWGIESAHWLRDTARGEDADTGYTGNAAQVMATLRILAISLLRLGGHINIAAANPATPAIRSGR